MFVLDTNRIFDRSLVGGLSISSVSVVALVGPAALFFTTVVFVSILGLKGLYIGSHVFDLVLHFPSLALSHFH